MKKSMLFGVLLAFAFSAAADVSVYAQTSPPGAGGTEEIRPAPETAAPGVNDATQRDMALLNLPAKPSGAGPTPFLWPINDPLERMNRAFYHFNNFLFFILINPLTTGYTYAVPEPARKSIQHFGYNLRYFGRLVNNLLQGKFHGAGVESKRFLVNTTIGLLGFFDPATKMGIGNYNEDFGQTFAHWGMGWGFYLFIPLVGTTSVRDGIGHALDSGLDPAGYVFADNFFMINDLSFTLPLFKRIERMELDPYVTNRDLWAWDRKSRVLDYDQDTTRRMSTPEGVHPEPTLETLYFRFKDAKFPQRMREHKVPIPATGKELPYSCRVQPHPAPLVFIVPGMGMHRLSDGALTMAEVAWLHGNSVVTVSSPMNWEFIEKAGTRALAGYTPIDAADMNAALGAIYKDLAGRYPGRFTTTELLGFSLGGLEALFIADLQSSARPGDFHFERIVAVDPPVDLVYALHMVDTYYQAPLAWPAAERHQRMESALLKASIVIDELRKDKKDVKLPFSLNESKYLIGFVYRVILRDIIFTTQRKQNQGVIQGNYGAWSRQETLDKIVRYSYGDYVRQFVMPYYQKSGMQLTPEEFVRRANMPAIGESLRQNPRVRVFANADDFLLAPEDIPWLQSTLGDRLTVFPTGGHLGNLHLNEVQDRVMQGFAAGK